MTDDETEGTEEAEPATEADAAWRARTQATNDLAEELSPPHDPDAERGGPSPNP